MNHTAAQVAQARLTIAGAVRLVSLFALLLSLWQVLTGLGWGLLNSGYTLSYLLTLDWLLDFLGFYGAGALLFFLVWLVGTLKADAIARWLVRFPKQPACPKCQFSLESFRAERCPECGVFLGPDFHTPPQSAENANEPD